MQNQKTKKYWHQQLHGFEALLTTMLRHQGFYFILFIFLSCPDSSSMTDLKPLLDYHTTMMITTTSLAVTDNLLTPTFSLSSLLGWTLPRSGTYSGLSNFQGWVSLPPHADYEGFNEGSRARLSLDLTWCSGSVMNFFGNNISVGGTFSWDFVILTLKFRYCYPVSF